MFKYGDFGESFFIVMSGTVDVIVPVPVTIEDKNSCPLGMTKVALNNFNEIAW